MNTLLDIYNLDIGYSKNTAAKRHQRPPGKRYGSGSAGTQRNWQINAFKTLAGLLPPLKGQLSGNTCAFVPSQPLRASHFSVWDTVSTGRYRYTNWLGIDDREGKQAVAKALEQTDTLHLAGRDGAGLSDGEFHRVAIARALVQNTPVLLLDEPTAFGYRQ